VVPHVHVYTACFGFSPCELLSTQDDLIFVAGMEFHQ
jgi:hypothetical protein